MTPEHPILKKTVRRTKKYQAHDPDNRFKIGDRVVRDACTGCGACIGVCPVDAIHYEEELPSALREHAVDNRRFFTEPLPGRDEPLGAPGGAHKVGPLGVDTPMVSER